MKYILLPWGNHCLNRKPEEIWANSYFNALINRERYVANIVGLCLFSSDEYSVKTGKVLFDLVKPITLQNRNQRDYVIQISKSGRT